MMHKIKLMILPLALLGMAGVGLMGCSPAKEKTDAAYADSLRMADSIAQVEAAREAVEQARLDSIHQDSIMQSEIDTAYKNGLIAKVGKPTKTWVPDQTDANITLPVTITNSTPVNLADGEYTVSYSVTEIGQADWPSDELIDTYRTGNKKGTALSAGESTVLNLFEECVLKISNPKVKLKISKQEFARRYKESK